LVVDDYVGWGDGGGGGVRTSNWRNKKWAVATQKEGGGRRKVRHRWW